MIDELACLMGNTMNLKYPEDFMLGRFPKIKSTIDPPTAIETTFKIAKEHIAMEESMLRYYVDLSYVVFMTRRLA
jgi:ATP-dependent RNA circularization protein (DNA/RNA ligase family)